MFYRLVARRHAVVIGQCGENRPDVSPRLWVEQDSPYSAAMFKLPESPSWSPYLSSVLESGFLKPDGEKLRLGLHAVHLGR